jgi:hypothetical protein
MLDLFPMAFQQLHHNDKLSRRKGQLAKMLHPKVQHLTRRINDEL